ncbi:VanZ family protein [Cellulomonas sp. ICMP 17802]|uniref:VanZ family protein n=1 Tax=Cellulomonas sp. ICMP 17802 TaxID=3239199 RepID=UPI00351B71AD
MSERQRRVVVGLLVAVLLVAGLLVLNPWHLQDAFDAPISRGLDHLHQIGLPEILNVHAAEFAANIALFVPLGLLGALLVPRRRWWLVLVALVALSIGIETVQAIGLPYRRSSARDVLGNSLGAAIGVGLSLLVRRPEPA